MMKWKIQQQTSWKKSESDTRILVPNDAESSKNGDLSGNRMQDL
jgi:hypothetical protein